jgi:hypothetical protein
MFDSYMSKVILMFAGAGAAMVGIAGGYYTVYRLVTLIGA